MCAIDDAPHAFLTAHLDHLLPREEVARVSRNRVNDRDDLVPPPRLSRVCTRRARGKRRDVRERGIGVRGAERTKLRAEGVDDLLVRHRKDELERVRGRPRRFGAVREELARL